MSSDKALLSRAELEFTKRFQLHFPCDVIPVDELNKWNGCKSDFLRDYIIKHFFKFPEFPEPVRIWHEENGVIYFNEPFVSDGTTGQEWIDRLIKKGRQASDEAKKRLLSPDFKPTIGVTTNIAILKGELFSDENRITKKIRAEAYAETFTKGKKLFDPNPEIGCMIRERLSDKEIEAMGLWGIVAMHEPIKDSDGDPDLLGARRDDDGGWLDASYDYPGRRWTREYGFAFAVAQVVDS